jgi:antitoxin (DNA-binding transcriptional repressor) of toxin-antitoxin stability system
MKTLTVSEASGNLAVWLQEAIAGEDIGIRTGDTIVALRPLPSSGGATNGERVSPREALQTLQRQSQLSAAQAEAYLNEVHAERAASEQRRTE